MKNLHVERWLLPLYMYMCMFFDHYLIPYKVKARRWPSTEIVFSHIIQCLAWQPNHRAPFFAGGVTKIHQQLPLIEEPLGCFFPGG